MQIEFREWQSGPDCPLGGHQAPGGGGGRGEGEGEEEGGLFVLETVFFSFRFGTLADIRTPTIFTNLLCGISCAYVVHTAHGIRGIPLSL